MRFLVESIRRSLSAQDEHRGPVHVGVSNAGDEISCAGTERAKASGRLAGQAAVYLSHERGPLLMTGQDEFYFFRWLQGHHEIGVFLARNAENVFNAFFLEAFDE